MGIKINLKQVPDSNQMGGAIALGKYPARLHIDAYQIDQNKNPILDVNNKPTYWRSSSGDPQWKMRAEILDGAYKGRELFDQLTFSDGGKKRIKVLVVRAGLASGDDEDFELEPEDLDKSMWYITIDRHEVAQTKEGHVKESKYVFRANGCACETCKAYDGKNANVNSRIAFAGFELMDSETAQRLKDVKKEAKGQASAAETDESLPF